MKATTALCLTATLALACAANAANWPHFRGPNYNGSTDEKNLPVQFSKTEGVAWSADMPGVAAATPVIWGDHVFVSSANTAEQAMYAFAFDRKSGKQLWSHKAGEGLRKDNNSTFSGPSPVTDGKVVVFFYGNGPLVAYDFAGKELWSRNLQMEYGKLSEGWTFSTSPLLYGGKLYMQVLRREDPYLLAIDPQTGRNLWKVTRDGKAVAESRDGFASPVPIEYKGRKEILIVGCDDLTGHDPETGKELWRWGTWNPDRIGHWRQVPSPAFADGFILACAPKRSPIYAIKCGGNGTLDDSAIAWQSEPRSPVSSDVPTPLTYLGDFFVLSEGGTLSRVEPKTGKAKWTTKVQNKGATQSSPTGADGKIYFQDFAGQTFVVNAEDGKLLATNAMGEERDNMIRASIAVAHGQLFIRTNSKLYCVGKN
ncbi:MAG: PQQ-binding-like beta-propeller repeat protein [Verrucomicrobia bacterium]|nr:PQQ-binding-like beta-propeller repeat protein [Verrucomicrobiota bacterium]